MSEPYKYPKVPSDLPFEPQRRFPPASILCTNNAIPLVRYSIQNTIAPPESSGTTFVLYWLKPESFTRTPSGSHDMPARQVDATSKSPRATAVINNRAGLLQACFFGSLVFSSIGFSSCIRERYMSHRQTIPYTFEGGGYTFQIFIVSISRSLAALIPSKPEADIGHESLLMGNTYLQSRT